MLLSVITNSGLCSFLTATLLNSHFLFLSSLTSVAEIKYSVQIVMATTSFSSQVILMLRIHRFTAVIFKKKNAQRRMQTSLRYFMQ